MGDVFIERMVKKKFESTDMLVTVGIFLAVLVVALIGFVVGFMIVPIPMLSLLVAGGAGFGGYKLISMRLLEYEYSLTNGYVAVDKIMNRSSRKRMTSFECSTAEDIGQYAQNEARLKNQSFDARIFATWYSDHRDACGLDGHGGVLTGGAAAEVPAAHHNIAVPDVPDKVLVDVLHAVAGQLLGVLGVQVAGRDDDIGIHVIRVFENRTFCVHRCFSFPIRPCGGR